MSSKTEGIPDGWELEKVGQVSQGEHWVNNHGQPQRWDSCHPSSSENYVIICKIEKPKQYRPFANVQEFLAHPLSGDWIDCGADTFAKVLECDDDGVWLTNMSEMYFFENAFCDLEFRDGTPFGVEVTE